MDLKEIKAIVDLMTRNGLSEFELEKADFKLRVKRGPTGEFITTGSNPIIQLPSQSSSLSTVTATPSTPPPGEPLLVIKSPMVGTFYRSPSPTSPAYIEVGQEVNENTVVCIIEAMKVMNEIKAEVSGVIVEVLAQNEKPVEYGKELFSVRPL